MAFFERWVLIHFNLLFFCFPAIFGLFVSKVKQPKGFARIDFGRAVHRNEPKGQTGMRKSVACICGGGYKWQIAFFS